MTQTNQLFRILPPALACAIGSTVFMHVWEAQAQAASQSESTSAADHAKRAQVAYDLQDWATAMNEYQAAYQFDQKPEYLWGLAQSQRLSGDCTKAISTYKAYRRGEVTQNQATAAELLVTKCEAENLKKEAEAASAAQKSQASPAIAAAPASAPAETSKPLSNPANDRPTTEKPFYTDALGDTLFLTGIVAGGVGTYFLLKGNSDMRGSTEANVYGDYDSRASRASNQQIAGVATLTGGSVLVAIATIRYLTLGESPRTQQSAINLGPTGIQWYGSF
jgi:hypothetical protein